MSWLEYEQFDFSSVKNSEIDELLDTKIKFFLIAITAKLAKKKNYILSTNFFADYYTFLEKGVTPLCKLAFYNAFQKAIFQGFLKVSEIEKFILESSKIINKRQRKDRRHAKKKTHYCRKQNH